MEAEVCVVDARSAELAQVTNVQKLFSSRQELAAQLQAIEDDLARARSESHEVPPIKDEIERACEGKFKEEGDICFDINRDLVRFAVDFVQEDYFDLDYTRQEDKFPSKEAALLKSHPDTTKNSKKSYGICSPTKHLCEQNKKNRSKLTVNHAAGSYSFQRTRACMKNLEAAKSIQQSCIRRIMQHRLAKARDEIEAMRATREKYLQEFTKKEAEMEVTLRDHHEEQRVEQESIRLEQEEHMKEKQERMLVEHEECMQKKQERLQAEYQRNWRRKYPL
ncbi:Protein FLC EXPRESSOR [Morella rubra]|uniref:Protein FLC EXPRESSOR n=1 Tax=Morella rubra TaxID=262757 RepID=A0A6A1WP44_9ROSI|nr:Protein FLC EXPRESSOR [Morella rubra]